MHNHVDHRWIKTFLIKIISILLVYSLFFTSTANAATVGGWSLGSPVAQGAKAIVEGTKQVVIDGRNYIKKGTAVIAPNASQVAKVLARGGAGYALSVAVEQLIGSVDWVLDPANNQIKYTVPAQSCEITNTCQYLYTTGYFTDYSPSAKTACNRIATLNSAIVIISYTETQCVFKNTMGINTPTPINRITNPAYQQPKDEEKSIPLETVAQKVIFNAESGNTNAQVATVAAAADIIAEAEKDTNKARPIANQIETSAQTRPADADAADKAGEAAGEAAPQADPVTGEKAPPIDLALEFPIFCDWVPIVCEASQTVISFPNTLTDWWTTANSKADEWALSISEAWTAAKEWAKNDENEDTDNDPPEIQEIDIGALDTSTFKGVPGCPAPIQVPITFGTGGETEISYEPICQLADKWSFVAPLIGFLSGAMILVGVGRKGEDGEI